MEQVLCIDELGYKAAIYYDAWSEDPLWDEDPVQLIMIEHRNYKLGHEQRPTPESCVDVIARRLGWEDEDHSELERENDTSYVQAQWDWIRGRAIIAPLTVHEHGTITLHVRDEDAESHDPPRTGWDTRLGGYAYVELEHARLLVARKGARGTPYKGGDKVRQAGLDAIKQTLSMYTDYINGEVYGYRIIDAAGNTLDSYWGYIGLDAVQGWAKASLQACLHREAQLQSGGVTA